MGTQIWAHRGSSHTFTENTLAAFKQALVDGVDGVELDVQRSKDGKLVVIHDENLSRLAGINRFVWEMSWQELQALSIKADPVAYSEDHPDAHRIPSLEEVLRIFQASNLKINIELKNSIHFYPDMEEEIVWLVEKMDLQDRVLYSSFNHESVHRLSQIVGSFNCGLLTSDILYQPWQYLSQVGARAYHPMLNSLLVTNLISKLRQHGMKIHVWTADEEAYINAALLVGVDAIITNEPQLALALRQKFGADRGESARQCLASLGIAITGGN